MRASDGEGGLLHNGERCRPRTLRNLCGITLNARDQTASVLPRNTDIGLAAHDVSKRETPGEEGEDEDEGTLQDGDGTEADKIGEGAGEDGAHREESEYREGEAHHAASHLVGDA